MIIDADGDTHIPQEVFDTYLDKEFHRNRPRYITFDDGRGYYIIEGRVAKNARVRLIFVG